MTAEVSVRNRVPVAVAGADQVVAIRTEVVLSAEESYDPDGDQLTFNPGECAGHMSGRNSVGVLDLTELRTEILYF